ncbi:uncharacterized protein F5891DRAFT_92572 [Suillus fuscotomentosus]|uniref:C2H2-type domain-containing protein n=1 Tax=Suillus fuscotomentosus TaxID=1912939 RepID=A0AAD4EBQ6_9AGAM|nr:uncharacterized protein F5891DRAFT_92572 [Suillus fuscotomentosus]KAG1903230.1 hypothetical protein F5891DRAFT_92572 [Suillus fuscotomentosus]
MSLLAHQLGDSQDLPMLLSSTNTAPFNNDLAIDPVEDRSIIVADVTTHVQHAPQPRRLWFDTIYTASCSLVGNQAIGSSIFRPPAPIFNQPQAHRALHHDSTIYSSSSHINTSNEHHSTHTCRWDNAGTPCSHEFTFQNIVAHLRRYHHIDADSDESFICSWITPHAGRCGKKLKIDGFRRHIITHIGVKFRCSVCRKRMAARKDLTAKHRRYHAACSRATFDIVTD